MAIQGPLRELGIHDVFQLLDLSRKTGTLTVVSELRDNQGVVYFDSGRVIHATIQSNPHQLGAMLVRAGKMAEADLERARSTQKRQKEPKRLGEILVEIGAITPKELERQVRYQVEAVVFELMGWREGFFTFEERSVDDVPAEATIRISTESLLMEAARRIDEWSRIADKVPHLGAVPVLAPLNEEHASQLDLLPNEWEVLTIIDGVHDLRGIAAALARSEFDIAKIAYGLVSTGVIELRLPERTVSAGNGAANDVVQHIRQSEEALEAGRIEEAVAAARAACAADPASAPARLALGTALVRLGRAGDAVEELRRAVRTDPLEPRGYLELGYALVKSGEIAEAITQWEAFLRLAPDASQGDEVRVAMESAGRLHQLLEGRAGV